MSYMEDVKPAVSSFKKRFALAIIPLALTLASCTKVHSQQVVRAESTGHNQPDYLNTALPLDSRVNALVESMTLEEKVAQMYNDAPAITRLGVPAYDYWNEALHGVARAGEATVFPQAIGLAAMWDRAFLNQVATVISDEGRAKHHEFKQDGLSYRYTGLTYWSPNINIFRDPRWGRGQETYGEDPYLTGELGVSFITGLQGNDDKYLKTAATAKHFAVHNGPEISRHSDNYVVSDKDLYETYLPAFEKAVTEANVEAVMCAYNRVNDAPACGSDMLLKEILRGKYGFDGHVMSDCGAIADFYDPKAHNVTASPAAAAAWAVTSGTDLNCGTGRLSSFANLIFAVQKGFIDESLIDQAVSRLFKTRFKLGMFDPDEDVPFASIPSESVGSESHLSKALQAAEKSLVMLKNNGILPLKKGLKVAVIGPNADNPDVLVGNYNGLPVNPVTALEGIRNYAGVDNVAFSAGSALIADVYGHWQVLDNTVLYHNDKDGRLVPGAHAEYFEVTQGKMSDFSRPHFPVDMSGGPVSSEVLDSLSFRKTHSPVTNKIAEDYGMVLKAVLIPEKSGEYRFDGAGEISIERRRIDGSVELEAGVSYDLEIRHIFSVNTIANTAYSHLRDWQMRWVNVSTDLLAESESVAQQADVIVMAVGISPRIEGEEMPVKLDGFNYGDRSRIDLPAEQQALIKAIHKIGKPVVVVNFSGSAMALNWEDEHADAIIQAFYPGEAAGTALAKILWGEVNPSGRLPVTFYKNLDGFAEFDDYSMANRTYRYFEGEVLYPFGHGLGYSEIRYSDLKTPANLNSGSDLEITVSLQNMGPYDAEQVTQLYVQMPDAPAGTPRISLKGFTRTFLENQTKASVSLTVPASELTYINDKGSRVAYKGKLNIFAGDGQPGYVDGTRIAQASININ